MPVRPFCPRSRPEDGGRSDEASHIVEIGVLASTTPDGYHALDDKSVASHLAQVPEIRSRLGGEPSAWRVSEVGDGNLNLVFIVEGPDGDVCVKQALPYVRVAGASWPLDLKRAWFEYRAASTQAPHTRGLAPQLLHYDDRLFLIAMERCQPHVIMRRGMLQGIVYPAFAEHIAEYLAATLYFTSDLALPAGEKKALTAAFCSNTDLCRITEDLVFTDPYMLCERNRWTSPQLDRAAAALREDAPLKRAVCALKLKFLSEAQALLHGDLHTGSIMVTEADTKVIDPEFAFVGPMGFDVGKLLGELLLSFFSQRGHEVQAGGRDAYRGWILAVIEEVWTRFSRRFVELWDEHPTGDAYPRALFAGPDGSASLRRAQAVYMRRLFEDALGYAGAAMIRRTLGFAHNLDMEAIADPDLRAACERCNLDLARDLLVNAAGYPDIAAVTARAAEIERAG